MQSKSTNKAFAIKLTPDKPINTPNINNVANRIANNTRASLFLNTNPFG